MFILQVQSTKATEKNIQYKQTLLRYQWHLKAAHPSLKMQKGEIFHSHDARHNSLVKHLSGKRQWHCLCYCEVGEEVWVWSTSVILSSFFHPFFPLNISLLFHNVSPFSIFPAFSCSPIFFHPQFQQKRQLCPLILLTSISKFYTTHIHKHYWIIFSKEYTKGKEGDEMGWG